jgi:hypothetical protein
MPQNSIEDLRNHLFAQLEDLRDAGKGDDPKQLESELARAKAVCQVASTIIDSARVEVKFLEAVGESDNKFFTKRAALTSGTKPVTPPQ